MALEITREELRSDIRESTAASVATLREELRSDIRDSTAASISTLREELRADMLENNHRLVRMINEDLYANNSRMNRLNKSLEKRLEEHAQDSHAHGMA